MDEKENPAEGPPLEAPPPVPQEEPPLEEDKKDEKKEKEEEEKEEKEREVDVGVQRRELKEKDASNGVLKANGNGKAVSVEEKKREPSVADSQKRSSGGLGSYRSLYAFADRVDIEASFSCFRSLSGSYL